MRAAGRRGRLDPGHEGARAPDTAEVVDAGHPLDQVEVRPQERPAGGHAGVVDEEVDRRVALEHAGRERPDGLAIADVAHLHLAPDLVREGAQQLLAARHERRSAIPWLRGRARSPRRFPTMPR